MHASQIVDQVPTPVMTGMTMHNNNNQRRAITPSPEKASIGMARRAITPTPNRSNAAPSADYQNLSVIQNKIFNGVGNSDEGGYVSRKALEQQQQQQQHQQYQNLDVIQHQIFAPNGNVGGDVVDGMMRSNKDVMVRGKQHPNLQRSLSAESTQLQDGLSIPEHLNQPRRRDSGNWSGDRNSASSSSSTTLDGPYMYLMGKRSGGHTPSPTRSSQNSGSPAPTGNVLPHHQFFDAGYDSYSLSSTDSYPPKHLNNSQLAKIPESVVLSGDCERLCKEADDLLEKSRYSEEMLDFETALILCNTAAGKARAALDAPYSNPHTMTFARMKHNTCVMRARCLHRRLFIEKGGISSADFAKDQQYVCANDMRNNVNGSGSLRHMRQNSKDNTLAANNKNIEIYATLPKKGKSPLKLIDADDAIEPDVQPAAPVKVERESRTLSIFGRGRRSEEKEKEKRSRSEDRNKHAREFSVVAEPLLANAKDTLKKHKEDKDEKCEKDKPNKKQHKVRRKILMGGLIRRKNRSMPDLTDANAQESEKDISTQTKAAPIPVAATVDDSSLALGGGMINGSENGSSISGYLSEGHFEYQTIITGGNPNLERSKLMRKNVQNGLAIRQQLTQVKVPPPPPLRTNSTLSQQQLQMHQQQMEKEMMPAMVGPIKPFHQANVSLISNMSSNTSMSEDSCQTIITTCAVVHQEQSPLQKQQQKDSVAAIDEVDSRFDPNLDLPPYPSPPASSCHSRQASEEFPPPPPTNELLDHPSNILAETAQLKADTMSILAQLQQRQQLLKQQKFNGTKQMNSAAYDQNQKSVKDLASRFEQIKLPYAPPTVSIAIAEPIHQQLQNTLMRSSSASQEILNTPQKPLIRTQMNGLLESTARMATPSIVMGGDEVTSNAGSYDEVDNVSSSMMQMPKNGLSKSASAPYLAPTKSSPYELPPSQIAEEMREVEMLNNVMHQTLHPNGYNNNTINTNVVQGRIPERTKKKSVSFCDQVILVATADDDEEDEFIPNPILERVLRTANYGNGSDMVDSKLLMQQQQNILRLQNEPLNRQQIVVPLQGSMSNENGYRHDLRAEAQKQQLLMHQQQEQQQQRHQPQNQIQTMYGQDGMSCIADAISKPINPVPMTNGGYNSPNLEHIQRSPVYNHNPMINSMHSPQQHQQQQQQLQQQRLVNNGMPSAYMQVPNINYVKSQRVQNFVANGYAMNGNGIPTTNAGVYQIPPHAPKYSMPESVPQIYHHISPPPQQPQQNGFPTAYQRVPMPHNTLTPMQQHFAVMQNVTQPSTKTAPIKKVSFEPGTKGESDANANNNNTTISTTPTTIASPSMDSTLAVTAIPTRVFNNSAIVKASAKAVQCNLCRKKHVIAPSIYCSDCEFYMSRFQPRV